MHSASWNSSFCQSSPMFIQHNKARYIFNVIMEELHKHHKSIRLIFSRKLFSKSFVEVLESLEYFRGPLCNLFFFFYYYINNTVAILNDIMHFFLSTLTMVSEIYYQTLTIIPSATTAIFSFLFLLPMMRACKLQSLQHHESANCNLFHTMISFDPFRIS